MTWPEALAWLYSTQQFGIKLGLENTHRMLSAVGNPERSCRFLHVAGTNGKGSVCAMMDSILRAGGYRTGLYTSPHLIDFRERIRVDGLKIPEENAARILTMLRTASEAWDHAPTYFELATVLAIRHFADANVDCAVLETGMGGRLDSTNAVTPVVSVLTPIAMDHAQWLGATLAAIASEKAGILKVGVPAVSAVQEPDAKAVIDERVESLGVAITYMEDAETKPWKPGLAGSHQIANAELAVSAIRAAGLSVSEDVFARGIETVEWPGRFQRVENFILDGAHNPHASARLVETWREEFGDAKATVIFGALSDKEFPAMLFSLAEIAREFWIVPVKSLRAAPVDQMTADARGAARVFPNLEAAVAEARRSAGPFLVTGSLFLVGEALAILKPCAAD